MVQVADYTKSGYGKKLIMELIDCKEEHARSYYSTMHNYSLYNTSLLMHQMMMRDIDLSPCCSFTRWKQLGYHVNRGEKGMIVLRPQIVKYKDNDDEEHTFIKFIVQNGVFAQSQTNCKKFDLLDVNCNGLDFQKMLKTLKLKMQDFDYVNGNVGGFATQNGTIAINSLLNVKQQVHTLLHEVAHHVLKHTDKNDLTPRDVKEFEADTTAYLCMKLIGIDNEQVRQETKHYIKNWVGSDNRLKELLNDKQVKKIMKAVETILKAGETTK